MKFNLAGGWRCLTKLTLAAVTGLELAGCTSSPLVPFSTDTPPLVLAPAAQAGVQDKRGRFREIYCAVLQARAAEVPDVRPCDDALTAPGHRTCGHGAAGAPGRVEPTPRRGGDAGDRLRLLRAVAAAARDGGPARAQVRLRAAARSRSTRCPAPPTTRARSAMRSWRWTWGRARRVSCSSAIRRARPTRWRRSSTIRRSGLAWPPW